MMKYVFGSLLSCFLAQLAWAGCNDTLTVSSPFDPSAAANNLNDSIAKCADTASVPTYILISNEDTLKLSRPIIVDRLNKKPILLSSIGKGGRPLILTRSNPDSGRLLRVFTPATVSNFELIKKGNPDIASQVFLRGGARKSVFRACYFYSAASAYPAADAIQTNADSMLIDRCFFRGTGYEAMNADSAEYLEIRSSLFYNSSVNFYANVNGFNLLANTFAGNLALNGNAVTVEKGIANFKIQHNLFVTAQKSVSPIQVKNTGGSYAARIFENAYSASSTSLRIAGSGVTTDTKNVSIPRGFSDYPLRDFPLIQIKVDSMLNPNHADFGKMANVYSTYDPSGISKISTVSKSSLIEGNFFLPFDQSSTWESNGLEVGALSQFGQEKLPSPLDSSNVNALKFIKVSTDSTKMALTDRNFNIGYYGSLSAPSDVYYFFSDDLSKLVSNDSGDLRAAVGSAWIASKYAQNDSILTVPKVVRTGNNVYVKMLHRNQFGYAHVFGSTAISSPGKFPIYPINDLTLTVTSSENDHAQGRLNFSIQIGKESIEKVILQTLKTDNTVHKADTFNVSGATIQNILSISDKASYSFRALPLGQAGGDWKTGIPSSAATKGPITFNTFQGTSLYVSYKDKAACDALQPVPDGSEAKPYCNLDAAVEDISGKGGSIILLPSAAVIEDWVISGSGTSPIFIVSTAFNSGLVDAVRPVIRGKAGPALTLSRPNVAVQGLILEVPLGSVISALSIKAPGATAEGNVFRPVAKGAINAPAITIGSGGNKALIRNNLTWGFGVSVEFDNAGSDTVRILNNTFVGESGLDYASGGAVGISVKAGDATAIVANNFFSGIKEPFASSVAGNSFTLDRNVFTATPDFRGLVPVSILDTMVHLDTLTVYSSDFQALELSLKRPFECNAFRECSPLFAGSATSTSYGSVDKDLFGKARQNKRDVGAYEYPIAANSTAILGRIKLTVDTTSKFSQLAYSIESMNYDSDDADSVVIWWSPVTGASRAQAGADTRSYPLAPLDPGPITGLAEGLLESKPYFFYAAFGKGGTLLGRFTAVEKTTNVVVGDSDCVFAESKTKCPSEKGFFLGAGAYSWIKTTVSFSAPAGEGSSVIRPAFAPAQDVSNIKVASGMPQITLVIKEDSLRKTGSKQSFEINLTLDSLLDLTDADLFLLPSDAQNLPSFVPNWAQRVESGKTVITINGQQGGTLRYVFGKLDPVLETGVVEPNLDSVPIFNLQSDIAAFVIPFQGSRFKTANPLIMVGVVPAGAYVGSRIWEGGYASGFGKPQFISSGIAFLADSLRTECFHNYYSKMAAVADSGSGIPGLRAPFVLDKLSATVFSSATLIIDTSVTASGTGALNLNSVTVRVSKNIIRGERGEPNQKASRSLEIVFAAFDGGKISYSRTFVRTRFKDSLHTDEIANFNATRRWSLFSYPWEELEGGSLARIVGLESWDPTNASILKYRGSGSGAGGFISYTGSNDAEFQIDSTRALWSGRRDPYEPKTNGGITLDYQTFVRSLVDNRWNDLGLPFNFPILWKDVLDSSGISEELNAWLYSTENSEWTRLKPTDVIQPWQGITIKPTSELTLRFPVIDHERTLNKSPVAKRSSEEGRGWVTGLRAFNSTASMELRIGKSVENEFFPNAPEAPGQNFYLALVSEEGGGKEKLLSEQVQAYKEGMQGIWRLKTNFDQNQDGIYLGLKPKSGVSPPIFLLESMHQTLVSLNGDTSRYLSPSELKNNDYHLVAGDKAYAESVLKQLRPSHFLRLSNFPNPFSSHTSIRYSLPEGFKRVEYMLKIHDSRGRMVWSQIVTGDNRLLIAWNGRNRGGDILPSGYYNLSLVAKVPGRGMFKAHHILLKL